MMQETKRERARAGEDGLTRGNAGSVLERSPRSCFYPRCFTSAETYSRAASSLPRCMSLGHCALYTVWHYRASVLLRLEPIVGHWLPGA